MHNSTETLELFESLAELVWGWLADARRLGLGFSEDTISDLTALKIARHQSIQVKVKRVSKQRERHGGFDWMWVIRRPAARYEVCVVQAKKLKLDQSKAYSYGTLKYRAGTKYQIDALEDFARWLGAKPLYCFYNNVDDDTAKCFWNCCQQQLLDVSQMGCTLVPLEVVRPVHDTSHRKNNFYSLHGHRRAVPWRCLFHPQCTGGDVGTGGDVVGSKVSAPLGPTQKVDRLDVFLESLTREGAKVDIDAVIDGLDLGWLVDKYATGSFLPIPKRFLEITLKDS